MNMKINKLDLDIQLNIIGELPKYLKFYGPKKCYYSKDNKNWTRIKTIYSRLFDHVYTHIDGCDKKHYQIYKLNN